MIIKIERHRENQEYWLFDGIRKISVSEMLPIGESDGPWAHHDIMLYDHLVGSPLEGYHSAAAYRLLVCRLINGKEMSVGFDTVCYIMNDNGKTMEKLTVHRKEVKDPTALMTGEYAIER